MPESRGRDAARPRDIPKAGWRDILLRIKDRLTRDHVSVVAAGVAFFGLLALFPAIGALISVAGLVMDPAQVEQELGRLAATLPPDAASILTDQASKVAARETAGGVMAAVGIVLAVYGASKGTMTLIEGINIAYGEEVERGFVMQYVLGLVLTLFLVLGMLIAIALVVLVPALLGHLGLPPLLSTLVSLIRWPILAAMALLGLAVLYRFAPDRARPRWRWVTPGALLATIIWVAGSIAFSIYVRNFGSYGETYGALGGVIILLTWLWLSAFIVLLGAEFNAEAEHQTERDSTTGAPQAVGKRGAVKADATGRVP